MEVKKTREALQPNSPKQEAELKLSREQVGTTIPEIPETVKARITSSQESGEALNPPAAYTSSGQLDNLQIFTEPLRKYLVNQLTEDLDQLLVPFENLDKRLVAFGLTKWVTDKLKPHLAKNPTVLGDVISQITIKYKDKFPITIARLLASCVFILDPKLTVPSESLKQDGVLDQNREKLQLGEFAYRTAHRIRLNIIENNIQTRTKRIQNLLGRIRSETKKKGAQGVNPNEIKYTDRPNGGFKDYDDSVSEGSPITAQRVISDLNTILACFKNHKTYDLTLSPYIDENIKVLFPKNKNEISEKLNTIINHLNDLEPKIAPVQIAKIFTRLASHFPDSIIRLSNGEIISLAALTRKKLDQIQELLGDDRKFANIRDSFYHWTFKNHKSAHDIATKTEKVLGSTHLNQFKAYIAAKLDFIQEQPEHSHLATLKPGLERYFYPIIETRPKSAEQIVNLLLSYISKHPRLVVPALCDIVARISDFEFSLPKQNLRIKLADHLADLINRPATASPEPELTLTRTNNIGHYDNLAEAPNDYDPALDNNNVQVIISSPKIKELETSKSQEQPSLARSFDEEIQAILNLDWRKEEADEDSIYAKIQNAILPIINSGEKEFSLNSFVQNLVTKENLSAHPYQVIRTLIEIAYFYPEAQIKAKLPKLDKNDKESNLSKADFEFNTYDLVRYALFDLLSKDSYEYHPSKIHKPEPGEMHFKSNDLPSLREMKKSFSKLKTRIKLKTIPDYENTPAGRAIKTRRDKLEARKALADRTTEQTPSKEVSQVQTKAFHKSTEIEFTPIEILSPAAKIIKDKDISEEVLRIFDTAIRVIFSYDENGIKGTLENLLSNRILQYGELANLKEEDTISFKSLKKRERVAILVQKLLSLDNFKSKRPLTVPASIHQLCNLIDPRVKFEIKVPTLDKIFQNGKTIESNFASETKVLSMIELYKYVLDFINKDLRSEDGRTEDPARNFKDVFPRSFATRKRKYGSAKTIVSQKLKRRLNPKTKS